MELIDFPRLSAPWQDDPKDRHPKVSLLSPGFVAPGGCFGEGFPKDSP